MCLDLWVLASSNEDEDYVLRIEPFLSQHKMSPGSRAESEGTSEWGNGGVLWRCCAFPRCGRPRGSTVDPDVSSVPCGEKHLLKELRGTIQEALRVRVAHTMSADQLTAESPCCMVPLRSGVRLWIYSRMREMETPSLAPVRERFHLRASCYLIVSGGAREAPRVLWCFANGFKIITPYTDVGHHHS